MAVDGRYAPLTAVDRDETCENARDGLKRRCMHDVRTSSSARFRRPCPAFARTFYRPRAATLWSW